MNMATENEIYNEQLEGNAEALDGIFEQVK